MSRKANKLLKQAQLMLASKNNPGARTKAREDGVKPGTRIRYLDGDGVARYGVVRSTHVRSLVVELSAGSLMKGGEDIIIRTDEIPFANVKEILGEGRLAQPKSASKPTTAMAPAREQGYLHCDFDDNAIYEVLRTSKGLRALCRDHAKGPTEDEPAPFKFRLGLIFETFHAWPKPSEQEIALAAAVSSQVKSVVRKRSKRARSSIGKIRKRRTSRSH